MNETMQSPCLTCRRVKEPANCDNKDCMLWRRWFIRRWDRMCALHGSAGSADPCDTCRCPRELCFEPCRKRLEWEAKQ